MWGSNVGGSVGDRVGGGRMLRLDYTPSQGGVSHPGTVYSPRPSAPAPPLQAFEPKEAPLPGGFPSKCKVRRGVP